MGRRILVVLAGAVALAGILPWLVAASPARADVLISPPGGTVRLGHSIRTGVWYQAYSGGPRWVKLSITHERKVVWSRRVTATTTWKYYGYRPRATGIFAVRCVVDEGRSSFRVRVRR